MDIKNAVVLITGASSGLGFETARLLAQRGAKLVIAARGAAALERAAAELRESTDVVAVAADVSEDAESIVSAGLARFGHIDALVNNASELGPSPMPALEALDWETFARILRVNTIAPLHLSQLVLPGMRARRHGVIMNISSDAGVNAYPGWGGYGASKAALEHLSRTLAAELGDAGIRVLYVDPGDMNTTMHQLAEPGVDLSGLAHPRAVAPAIVALIEDESAAGRYQAQELASAVV
ncbi:MAG: SDR family oxidoreductase [Candidatus Eremiobacteraeota bacterium]|nr:SDR family oxidoreductase [Candidatus Eremiobacteraeota bacterium]MBV8366376.1 SDR family oxidoreductase [Candidatus Eremiobacteraeota bacterium]